MEILGKRLKEVRAALGLTQEDVANAMEINQSQISFYERGNGDPSLSTLRRFANLYGMTLSELFSGEPVPERLLLPRPKPRDPTPAEVFTFVMGNLKLGENQKEVIRAVLGADEELAKKILRELARDSA
jgi:transcriptional regulator with XRE-family HTH domain